MKRFFKTVALLGVLALCLFPFAGCGGGGGEKTFEIVCTIFPQYDWIKNVTEGNHQIGLTLLQDSGTDLHNYQPTAADKVKILKCDLLVYVGGESDEWVEEMLSDPAKNPDMKILKLLDLIDALDEEQVPGGEAQEEGGEEKEKDEHVWLSLKNARKLVEAIAKELQEADPENGALYESNEKKYLAQIDGLEQEFAEATKNPARKILLFGDRFPFRYLVEDYDLSYFAAFSGCSAESEASFEVIRSLARAVDENSLPYILVLENSDKKIAEQIRSSTSGKDQTILSMNSIQSVTRAQIQSGANYLSLMRENLQTLKTALN